MPDTPFLMAALVYVAAGVTMEALTSRRKQHAVFGMGRFWGPQQLFSELAGVEDTTAGYAHKEGAQIVEPIPEVRLGNIVVAHARASHTEVVRVTFDPVDISYEQMLKVFWEHHDPTQSQRQGDDVGPQ